MIKTHQTLPPTRKALLFARRTEHFLPFLYKTGPGAKLAPQQGTRRLLLSPSAPQLLACLVPGSARAATARPCSSSRLAMWGNEYIGFGIALLHALCGINYASMLPPLPI